jgi:chromosome partitioning protein
LVDVDHQSSLSLTILKPKEWEKVVDEGKTIDAVFQHFTTQNTKLPGKEIIYPMPYGKNYPKLDLVPATLHLDETELDLASTIVGNAIESDWNKRTLICKWIEQNNIDSGYDYIIFDCPPATKLVTQNAIATSHGYIVSVIPDAVSTRGTPHLIERMFGKISKKFSDDAEYLKGKINIVSTYVPHIQLVAIVISKIKTSGRTGTGYTLDHYRHLTNIQNLYPKSVIEPYIVEGVGVPECMARGYPVYDFKDSPNVRNRHFIQLFRKLTDELKTRIDKL